MSSEPIARDRRATSLILLCWLAYAASYVGKLSYNANISQFEAALGISHADAGMVSTFFFFAYGAGQVVNGILCKHYPIKPLIFSALTVASCMNVLVVLVPTFAAIKFIWLVNGIAMSFLWTSLIRLLSETLDKKDIPRAVFLMGTTVASGTFVVYGLSAIFAAVGAYKITFFIAAALMMSAAAVWLLSFDRFVIPLRAARKEEKVEKAAAMPIDAAEKKAGRIKRYAFFFAVILSFAVANNFVKDGLTAWTPSMLSKLYETPGWLSILLTLLLPVLAIAGAGVALRLRRRVVSFVATCTIFFSGSALLVLAVVLLLPTGMVAVTVACFGIISCMMAGVNNVITSMIPLHMKDSFNSGRMAGIINGFCYLGSTLSTYGLGLIADNFDWIAVFYVLLAVAAAVAVFGTVFIAISYLKNRKKPQEERIIL